MRADTSATLDPALAMRPPTEADFDAVLALIVACDVADYGAPDYTAEDLRDDWRGLDLATDVRLILAGEAVVGCGGAANRDRARRGGVVYTHPRHNGHGIGTALTRFVEERAREKARASGRDGSTVEFHVPTVNEAALVLTANEGFQPVRYMLRMAIAMTVPPPEPAWPPGVTLRAYDNTAARAVHEAIEESFADHWGQEPRAFEEFRRRAIKARATTRRSGSSPGTASTSPESRSATCPVASAGWRRSACGARGAATASLWRCCITRSANSGGAASTTSPSASTRRASPAPPASTNAPACTRAAATP